MRGARAFIAFLAGSSVIAGAACGGAAFRSGAESNGTVDATVVSDGNTPNFDAAGDADAGSRVCDGSFLADPTNCGACGHDCLGGACEGGVCGPVTMASGEANPIGVAVQGGVVYWSTRGPDAIRAMPVDRSTTPRTFATITGGPTGYIVATRLGLGVAVTGAGRLELYPYDGGARTNAIVGENSPLGITVFGDVPFWSSENDGTTVRTIGADGGPTNVVGAAFVDAEGLATDVNGGLYVADWGGAALRARNPDDGGTRDLAAGFGAIAGVGVGGGEVYFTSWDDGVLRAVSVAGTGLRVVAKGQPNGHGVAVTANAVYWANGNRISRIAR